MSGLFTNVQATISKDNFLESLNKKPSSVKILIKSTYPIKMVKTILMWLFQRLFKIFNSPCSHFSKNNTYFCCDLCFSSCLVCISFAQAERKYQVIHQVLAMSRHIAKCQLAVSSSTARQPAAPNISLPNITNAQCHC